MKKPKPSYMCKDKCEWLTSFYSYLEDKYGTDHSEEKEKLKLEQQEEGN